MATWRTLSQDTSLTEEERRIARSFADDVLVDREDFVVYRCGCKTDIRDGDDKLVEVRCARHGDAQRRADNVWFRVPARQRQLPLPVEWVLPHEGAALPSCGETRFEGHYAGDHVWHARRYKADCASFECATCRCILGDDGKVKEARGWEHRESIAIERRVVRARADGFERGRPIHLVVSPNQEEAKALAGDTVGFRRLRTSALRSAKRVGFRGGALVYHHFRIPSRWNDRIGCSEGPHFHAIGYGWIDDVSREFERTGAVVVNLGLRKSVYSTALYVLSHATRAAKPGYAPQERGTEFLSLAVTWFGTLSYNKMPRSDADEAPEGRLCEICDVVIPDHEWERLDFLAGCEPPDKSSFFVHDDDLVVAVDEFELARRYGPLARDARASGWFKEVKRSDDEN